MKKLLDNKWIPFIIAVSICILIGKFINNFDEFKGFFANAWDIFFPCTLGLIIALFINRPVTKFQILFEKSKNKTIKKHSLSFSLLCVYTIIAAIIVIVVNFIVPPVYHSIQDLIKNLPSYYEVVKKFLENNDFIKNLYSAEKIVEAFQKVFNADNITKYIGVISGIANSFLTFFIGIIISIYLIIEKSSIFAFFKQLQNKIFTGKRTRVTVRYIKKSVNMFYSYFSGLFLDAVIVGILSTIIFSILKIPYSPVLGIVIAIGNLIPFFGPILSTAVVAVISAITLGPVKALWIVIMQFVIAQLDANLLQPKILSQSTGISPLLVLLSVTVFGGFFGAAGMILGVPICAILKAIVLDYLSDGVIDGK